MATASQIHLEASQKPAFYVEGLTEESARKASELLQENHDKHHIFFNQSGFHVSLLPYLPVSVD
jgi:UDP-N-acetyl-D-mannosaminuronic acid transferase (WecB/TagA/CpsF family)